MRLTTLLGVAAILGGVAQAAEAPLPQGCEDDAAAATALVRAYIDNFNTKDIRKFESTMHFPNVRHADGKIAIMNEPSNDQGMFDAMAAMGWDHTTLDSAEVVQCGEGKVHVAVRVTRHGKDAPLHSFNSLYVVTEIDGKWGLSMRSSYAPEKLTLPPR